MLGEVFNKEGKVAALVQWCSICEHAYSPMFNDQHQRRRKGEKLNIQNTTRQFYLKQDLKKKSQLAKQNMHQKIHSEYGGKEEKSS